MLTDVERALLKKAIDVIFVEYTNPEGHSLPLQIEPNWRYEFRLYFDWEDLKDGYHCVFCETNKRGSWGFNRCMQDYLHYGVSDSAVVQLMNSLGKRFSKVTIHGLYRADGTMLKAQVEEFKEKNK